MLLTLYSEELKSKKRVYLALYEGRDLFPLRGESKSIYIYIYIYGLNNYGGRIEYW